MRPIILPRNEQLALVRAAQAGDKSAREKLIHSSMGFLHNCVMRYRSYLKDSAFKDDLMIEAMRGLNHAIDKFDFKFKVTILTYAVHWINAYIRNKIMADVSIVKCITTMDARRNFWLTTGIEINDNSPLGDIARRKLANVSLDKVTSKYDSGDGGSDGGFQLFNVLSDKSPLQDEKLDTAQYHSEAVDTVRWMLNGLDTRLRDIVISRCMVDPPICLEELGVRHNVSRERIRQLLLIALGQMAIMVNSRTSPVVIQALVKHKSKKAKVEHRVVCTKCTMPMKSSKFPTCTACRRSIAA